MFKVEIFVVLNDMEVNFYFDIILYIFKKYSLSRIVWVYILVLVFGQLYDFELDFGILDFLFKWRMIMFFLQGFYELVYMYLELCLMYSICLLLIISIYRCIKVVRK